MPPPDDSATETAISAQAPSQAATVARTGMALIATFAIGLAGGYGAKLLHFPLPYMTGAFVLIVAG